MKTTRSRFIAVALMVCLFAIGMATFLNYFKYKSTVGQTVNTRLLEIGRGIENSVHSSLALGMGFTELGMLPSLIVREKAADPLISAIEVFDTSGRVLYSTDRSRVGETVSAEWLAAATRTKGRGWMVEEPREFVTGLTLKNNFNLTVGMLAMRYARDYVDRNVAAVGLELVAISALAFVIGALLASVALLVVLRRFERDMGALEARVANLDSEAPMQVKAFGPLVEELRAAINAAENSLAQARAKLPAAE